MIDLQELRKEIDKIDSNIVELYEKRMKICEDVAEYKISTGKAVFDKEREDAKIKAVKELANTEFTKCGVEELFTQIMAMGRKLQYQLLNENGIVDKIDFYNIDSIRKKDIIVVYPGVEGAFSQIAMQEYFGSDVKSYNVETFKDAMEELKNKMADFAVIPIENSSAGMVNDSYDLMAEYDNYIVGEHIVKIEQALLGTKDAQIEDIETVYSHPQGLMQSAKFLDEHREWKQISLQNTAISAMKVFKDDDKTQAAIASTQAAKTYDLKVLKDKINFSDTNSTRFIVMSNKPVYTESADKVSVCFLVPHESGTLYNALSHFIYNGINMSKIESRPLEGKPWEYRFFIDFEGNLDTSAVKNALKGLRAETINLKILGNYKKYED